ncbi:hypothetical protein M0R45_024605 [Rubus argutus]|uniref:Uncharacterized protein n=1 Tax=Rubus argutus TaxID=59490 RepID=A0AAW1WS80_RUBAR
MSHLTGHSLVQLGKDTERFTLRPPFEVRKQIVNRELQTGPLECWCCPEKGVRGAGLDSARVVAIIE